VELVEHRRDGGDVFRLVRIPASLEIHLHVHIHVGKVRIFEVG
jgi:hypothetical protein